MDLKPLVDKQKQSLHRAELMLNEALNALSQFAEIESVSTKGALDAGVQGNHEETSRTQGRAGSEVLPTEFETETDLRNFQLILQYRLSNHDALRALLQFQQSLWQILGIGPGSSEAINYERLAYALGSDDLHFLLLMLNQLADALLKLIARIENKNKKREGVSHKKTVTDRSASRVGNKKHEFLQKAIDKQAAFTVEMLDLTHSLQGIAGAPEIGEVLDNIAALQGPISRFYQALQNGMVLAGSLYQQLSVSSSMTPRLRQILEEVHHVLELAAPHLEPQRFFAPEKVRTLSGQDLEARAMNKRLRSFFP